MKLDTERDWKEFIKENSLCSRCIHNPICLSTGRYGYHGIIISSKVKSVCIVIECDQFLDKSLIKKSKDVGK